MPFLSCVYVCINKQRVKCHLRPPSFVDRRGSNSFSSQDVSAYKHLIIITHKKLGENVDLTQASNKAHLTSGIELTLKKGVVSENKFDMAGPRAGEIGRI